MKAAGLNPMLAYGQSPGSSPTAQQVQLQNPAASALEAYQKSQERDVMAAQVGNILADTKAKEADTKVKDEQAKLIAAQKLAADADERLKTTTANEATHRLWSQQNVHNPTQKALAASYWSQIAVNKANLPKIASEIVSNGAYAAQARAQADKAIAERKITQADLTRALNEQAYEAKSGPARPFIRDIGNVAGAMNSAAQADRARRPYVPSRRSR
jgi:chaperonin cofactor prefoldin